MADHVRTQIRGGLVTLVTGLPTTGSNVTKSRVRPVETSALPHLFVYNDEERITETTVTAPRVLERAPRFQIAGVARAGEDLDDVLDEICKEVEIACAMPGALEGLAASITLISTVFQMNADAKVPVGAARMTFEVICATQENAPDVAL